MARIHARRKGKAGSKKPLATTSPGWLRYKPEEIRQLVIKMAKKGESSSSIGLTLRDTYGIPDIKMSTKLKISKILEEAKLAPKIPEDIQNLVRRAIQIKKHMEKNKKDMVSKRGLQLTESKILRLAKHYKRTGKLPKDWKYDPEKVRLLVS